MHGTFDMAGRIPAWVALGRAGIRSVACVRSGENGLKSSAGADEEPRWEQRCEQELYSRLAA